MAWAEATYERAASIAPGTESYLQRFSLQSGSLPVAPFLSHSHALYLLLQFFSLSPSFLFFSLSLSFIFCSLSLVVSFFITAYVFLFWSLLILYTHTISSRRNANFTSFMYSLFFVLYLPLPLNHW